MISIDELNKTILDLETNRDTTYATCERLAWLYIVRDHLTQKMSKEPLALAGESEFLAAVNGKCGDAVWKIMDELAETVKMLHPRVYESVIRKLNDL